MKRRIVYISAKLLDWHFKHNFIGKMIVLRNQFPNLSSLNLIFQKFESCMNGSFVPLSASYARCVSLTL